MGYRKKSTVPEKVGIQNKHTKENQTCNNNNTLN